MSRLLLASVGILAFTGACRSSDASGGTPGSANGPMCGPLMYILDAACRPLEIGSAADASVADVATADADSADSSYADFEIQDAPSDATIDLLCDAGQPVQACVQYFATVSQCYGRDFLALACQDSLIPTSDATYAGIEATCLDNLQRFRAACR